LITIITTEMIIIQEYPTFCFKSVKKFFGFSRKITFFCNLFAFMYISLLIKIIMITADIKNSVLPYPVRLMHLKIKTRAYH